MSLLPTRETLASQTATILRREIERGAWREFLPGERTLCAMLQISRNTLRAALAQLQRENLVRPEHGSGNRILHPRRTRASQLRSHDVALLAPAPLEQLRPTQTLWIDEMRALLSERGCRLHLFHGRQFFRTNPGPALARLTAQHPHGCWVLALSNETTQRWFARNIPRCVVAGSVYADIALPFRDLDHRAMCRHAAGALLGLGHRRLAIVIQRSRLAGDIESERGFVESVQQSRHEEATVSVCAHDATVPGICHALRRLMEQRPRPTALLVANAFHFLTVVTRLFEMGIRVPGDVSVISRDEDPFLSFVVPEPARYVAQPRLLAKALLSPVLELLEGGVVAQRAIRIMPDFLRGASLAPPPEP